MTPPITPAAVPTTACPTCREPVAQPRVGRPRTYCSAACRREMYGMVADLIDLEREYAATLTLVREAHDEMWRQRHERMRASLRLAIGQAQSRIAETEKGFEKG